MSLSPVPHSPCPVCHSHDVSRSPSLDPGPPGVSAHSRSYSSSSSSFSSSTRSTSLSPVPSSSSPSSTPGPRLVRSHHAKGGYHPSQTPASATPRPNRANTTLALRTARDPPPPAPVKPVKCVGAYGVPLEGLHGERLLLGPGGVAPWVTAQFHLMHPNGKGRLPFNEKAELCDEDRIPLQMNPDRTLPYGHWPGHFWHTHKGRKLPVYVGTGHVVGWYNGRPCFLGTDVYGFAFLPLPTVDIPLWDDEDPVTLVASSSSSSSATTSAARALMLGGGVCYFVHGLCVC
jgi:hypothetical protein